MCTLKSRGRRAAKHQTRISAAIYEYQRLRARFEARGDGFAELRGKRTGSMRGSEIFAQIHNFHGRERAIFHPRFELEKMIFPGARVVKTLERRCSRTQQRHRALELR